MQRGIETIATLCWRERVSGVASSYSPFAIARA